MTIDLIVPVFNEVQTIPLFHEAIQDFVKNQLPSTYQLRLIFINDGSQDQTLDLLRTIAYKDTTIKVLSFSRNFGKEVALFAGLEYSTADIVIPIDVDLQDPLEVILEMLEKQQQGFDVVLAKRIDRSNESYLKQKSAAMFYRFHNRIAKSKIEENVGDFRLMTRVVVNELVKLKETQLFMKGLLSWVGFKTAVVDYKRNPRIAGVTKFNGKKLWNLALEGITSFSTFPLKVWTYMGLILVLFSFILIIKVVIEKIFFGIDVTGYASLMVAILLIGSFVLMGIGILGEYIGRIYMEVKGRTRYIVEEKINV